MKDSTIIDWMPAQKWPEEGSYVLVKYQDSFGTVLCSPATYEHGIFSEICSDYIFEKSRLFGWSYFPYDDRIKRQGV